eukprot:3876879-Prymnesium_polylepis.1
MQQQAAHRRAQRPSPPRQLHDAAVLLVHSHVHAALRAAALSTRCAVRARRHLHGFAHRRRHHAARRPQRGRQHEPCRALANKLRAGLRDAGLRDAGLRDAGLRDAGLRARVRPRVEQVAKGGQQLLRRATKVELPVRASLVDD